MLTHHLSFVLLAGLAAAAPASSVRGSPENGGRPFPADYTSDQPFVCDWRSLAWEFAKKVQPRHDARITFDALMLGATCNMTRPAAAPDSRPAIVAEAACDVYVAVDGDDSHSGKSAATALKTPAAGLAASRSLGSRPRVLCIGAGTYFLDAELTVTALDSHLTIRGSSDGQTWLSGARDVPALTWSEYKVEPATRGSLETMKDTDNQAGCTPNDSSAHSGCGCYNLTSTAAACEARCEKLGPKG